MSLNIAQLTSVTSKYKQLIASLNVIDSMAEQIVQQLANDKSVSDEELIKPARIREGIIKSKSRAEDLLKQFEKELYEARS